MYFHHLDYSNAQKIADGIMKIVPYNINIMDNNGKIIASGDLSRIGQIHQGALRAVEMAESYVVYEDTLTERKGINLPILFNRKVVGVIGISGRVEDVMQIGQIVVVTAQLMLENQAFSDTTAIKESRLKDFLYDWISFKGGEYSEELKEQAGYFGIDISIPRTAIILKCNRVRYSAIEKIKYVLDPDEYIVRQRMDEILILLRSDGNIQKKTEKILSLNQDFSQCFVGDSDLIASKAINWATQTYNIAANLRSKKSIIYFREVSLECMLANVELTNEVKDLVLKLQEADPEGTLKDTICAYVENTHDYALICENLHIHRNTLNYRLGKIEELLDKNPRCGRDLMLIYQAIVRMRNP